MGDRWEGRDSGGKGVAKIEAELSEIRERVAAGAVNPADARRYLELMLFAKDVRARDAIDLARALGHFGSGKGELQRAQLREAMNTDRSLEELLKRVEEEEGRNDGDE